MENIIHVLSSDRGIYIPRDFICDDYNDIAVDYCAAWGLTEENKSHWEPAADMGSDYYWEAWEWILIHAQRIYEGKTYSLHQDDDLWAIAYNDLTDDEKLNFFGEL